MVVEFWGFRDIRIKRRPELSGYELPGVDYLIARKEAKALGVRIIKSSLLHLNKSATSLTATRIGDEEMGQ